MWKTKEKKKLRADLHKIDTLIGKNTGLVGDLHFNGGLQLDGVIRGNVAADENSNAILIVGENGRIEGEVRVPNIIIRGQVAGPVHATQTLELSTTSAILGDVFYNQIEVMMGAKLNGKMVCIAEKTLHGELTHEKVVEMSECNRMHSRKEPLLEDA